jgi:hypothetical protein
MATRKKKKGTATPADATPIHDIVCGPTGRITGTIPSHWTRLNWGYKVVMSSIQLLLVKLGGWLKTRDHNYRMIQSQLSPGLNTYAIPWKQHLNSFFSLGCTDANMINFNFSMYNKTIKRDIKK